MKVTIPRDVILNLSIIFIGCLGCENTNSNPSLNLPSEPELDQENTQVRPADVSVSESGTSTLPEHIDANIAPIIDLSIHEPDASDTMLFDAIMPTPQPDLSTDAMTTEPDQSVESRTSRSLVIALDGVRPDALAFADTPHIDALISGTWHAEYRGAYTPFAQNLYDASTVSGPNHASIMTGANSQQHQVSSNGDVGAGNYTQFPHYLSRIEAAHPDSATAYLFTWRTDIEIPSGADYIKDDDDATNVERVVAMLQGTHADPMGDAGTSWVSGTQPHAIFLFLDDPDHEGHAQGFELNIASYVDELTQVDQQIGAIMNALVNRPTWEQEDWQIVITSDHGGYHTSHGGMSAPEHTIPFLVVSRSVIQGQLPPGTRNLDVAPTVLDHMTLPIPPELTGQARGADAHPPAPLALGSHLVGYYRFEGDLTDLTGRGNHGAFGLHSDIEPVFSSASGKFGTYLSISDSGGGESNSSYVTLGRPTDYDFGIDDAMTVTLWFRSRGVQGGDPVIIGNKDWSSGSHPGWLLLANEGADHSFGANYAGEGRRLDLEDIDYNDTNWWFLAATFDPAGVAILFCGDSTGKLRWMALDAHGVGGLTSPLPLQIGQDGTGSYPHNLNGDVDDLGIWRRALSLQEVYALYHQGRGQELMTLLNDP